MQVSDIYSLARTLTYSDTSNMPDADAQKYLRLTYRDLINAIKAQVNEDFFYNEWTADTVASQREYTLPARTGSVDGCNKLLGVSVKYLAAATEFTKCEERSFSNVQGDMAWFSTNQPKDAPFYVISDNSVFLYPSPSTSVTGGLKLYGIADPIDVSTAGAESTVKIPLEFHETLSHGIAYWYFVANGKPDKTQEAFQRYEMAKRTMVSTLSDRTVSPKDSQLPDLSNLG